MQPAMCRALRSSANRVAVRARCVAVPTKTLQFFFHMCMLLSIGSFSRLALSTHTTAALTLPRATHQLTHTDPAMFRAVTRVAAQTARTVRVQQQGEWSSVRSKKNVSSLRLWVGAVFLLLHGGETVRGDWGDVLCGVVGVMWRVSGELE